MYAFVDVVLKSYNRILQQQLATLQLRDREVVGRGMGNRLGQFGLKRPVLLFEFRKVHWHRHTIGLHKSIFPSRMEFCHDFWDKSMAVCCASQQFGRRAPFVAPFRLLRLTSAG
jgi:hypothetical protein